MPAILEVMVVVRYDHILIYSQTIWFNSFMDEKWNIKVVEKSYSNFVDRN